MSADVDQMCHCLYRVSGCADVLPGGGDEMPGGEHLVPRGVHAVPDERDPVSADIDAVSKDSDEVLGLRAKRVGSGGGRGAVHAVCGVSGRRDRLPQPRGVSGDCNGKIAAAAGSNKTTSAD